MTSRDTDTREDGTQSTHERRDDPARAILGDVVVEAPVADVWEAWTTEPGIRSFFAPDCHIEPRVDGLYEIFFDSSVAPGSRGSEGMRILAFEPGRMLAFTWNAPPHLPHVRNQRTSVVLRFFDLDGRRTRVTLRHGGWGEGDEWNQAFAYFERAWNDVVLPRLVHRFSVGPVDWDDLAQRGTVPSEGSQEDSG
jgi:uncharacterized protein YndB with AHSA1/START domain